MSAGGAGPRALGKSRFNYADYTEARFVHYFQQIRRVLALRPRRVLEIGPGDHTVADFLQRKGITVRTLDNDVDLRPDYVANLRRPLPIAESFDVVLASEVFEHFRFEELETLLAHVKAVLAPGGRVVVSLPYSTIRLFPPRGRSHAVLSCEGRLHTGLPYYALQAVLTVVRGLYRTLVRREPPRRAFAFYPAFVAYPADRHDVHHWDLGTWPTTRRRVRAVFARHFAVIEEHVERETNCVFFVLRLRHDDRGAGPR